ncbi:hypothetical protein [Flavobacterium psychrophilum]|uniref:hypothetical protein n=1 Tax=Flavobacterium psychrophilum TaxID=96345 RepID=UPI00106C3FAF|nr:hypothetical protein [Flavobacterium psychrophilum]
MKYIITALCIIFLIIDFYFNINPIFRNVIFGIMSIVAILFLFIDKNNNGLNTMFENKKKENKSIFNVKDLFKK